MRRAYRVVAIESTKRAVSGEGWRVSGKGHSTYGPNPGAKRSLRCTNSTPLLISDNSRNTPPSLSVVSRSLRLSTFNFGIYLSIFAPLSLSLSTKFDRAEKRGSYVDATSIRASKIGGKTRDGDEIKRIEVESCPRFETTRVWRGSKNKKDASKGAWRRWLK